MKVILLTPRSSGSEFQEIGEEITVGDAEAHALVSTGQAKAKSPKEYKELLERMDEAERVASEREARILATQKEEELKNEAYALMAELRAVVSAVATINPKFVDEIVEKFHDLFVDIRGE